MFQSSLYLAEDLIFKVVQSLSHELDSFNKRKWDHIIVNQFLRDIREAKKRGNTERRHKEAQAILAAAAPAPCVAPSSRNVTFKQDAENDAVPVKQEVHTVLVLVLFILCYGYSFLSFLCCRVLRKSMLDL